MQSTSPRVPLLLFVPSGSGRASCELPRGVLLGSRTSSGAPFGEGAQDGGDFGGADAVLVVGAAVELLPQEQLSGGLAGPGGAGLRSADISIDLGTTPTIS
jgi:hypothetical protein